LIALNSGLAHKVIGVTVAVDAGHLLLPDLHRQPAR